MYESYHPMDGKPDLMKTTISIIICTKNRSKDLSECLDAIRTNGIRPYELIIIDNGSTDTTQDVIHAFARHVPYPVRHIPEKRNGFPIIYNRGLKEARKSDWAIFIDDDCVAAKIWSKGIVTSIHRHPDAAVIVGDSQTYHTQNIFSIATAFHLYYWKWGAIKGKTVMDYEVLDNKNIAYNIRFLRQHHIRFDESRVDHGNGAAEDCDIGMQIFRSHGKAFYAPLMRVMHKDPTTWNTYIGKTVRSYQAYLSFSGKWDTFRRQTIKRLPRPNVIIALKRFFREEHISFPISLLVSSVVMMTYIIKKIRCSVS